MRKGSKGCYHHSIEHRIKMAKRFSGSGNPSWKGGKIIHNGYVKILIPGTSTYVREHRMIMEKLCGRKLKKSEYVHHVNGNPLDNRINNL